MEEARNQIVEYIRYYNDERLHSAIGYIAPKDKMEGHDIQIFTERDQKLEVAREARKQKRLELRLRPNSQQISTTAANFNSLTQKDNFSISIWGKTVSCFQLMCFTLAFKQTGKQ